MPFPFATTAVDEFPTFTVLTVVVPSNVPEFSVTTGLIAAELVWSKPATR